MSTCRRPESCKVEEGFGGHTLVTPQTVKGQLRLQHDGGRTLKPYYISSQREALVSRLKDFVEKFSKYALNFNISIKRPFAKPIHGDIFRPYGGRHQHK